MPAVHFTNLLIAVAIRVTLARRFSDAVGTAPLAYLSNWRMRLATQRVKHTTESVESIARDVGYTSEYASNRAFSRHRGHYRRLAQSRLTPRPEASGSAG